MSVKSSQVLARSKVTSKLIWEISEVKLRSKVFCAFAWVVSTSVEQGFAHSKSSFPVLLGGHTCERFIYERKVLGKKLLFMKNVLSFLEFLQTFFSVFYI